MTEEDSFQNKRPLAGIEAELHEAELAYADANARYMEAECDRRIALETISKRQIEIDTAVGLLRERSIPGTRWNTGGAAKDAEIQPLDLSNEDMLDTGAGPVEDNRRLTSHSSQEKIEEELGKLRENGRRADEDPVLKVISGRRN